MIPEMPWPVSELLEVAAISSGGTPSKSRLEYWEGGDVPWITARDMKTPRIGRTSSMLTQAGAVGARLMPSGTVFVLTRGMTLFRDLPIVLNTQAAAFNQDIKALTPSAELDPDFLAAILTHRKPELLQHVSTAGHGTGRLDTQRLELFPIPMPPLPEQQRIVQILRTWDEAIDQTLRLRGLAETRRAELAERLLAATYSGRRRLSELTRSIKTRNPGSTLGRVSVMGVSNRSGLVPMREQTIAADIARYQVLPPRAFAYNPMRINVGSIAMSRLESSVLVSPDYVLFECIERELRPEYLDHVLKTRWWLHHVKAGSSGSVRTRTYYDDLAAISIPAPSVAEQDSLSRTFDELEREIELLQRKAELLRTQKRGLMQKLLTGQVRVNVAADIEPGGHDDE